MGESLVEGGDVDSSPIFNWMGMSECVLMEGEGSVEMLQSVTGTGEGAGEGGRLSCIDGVGESRGRLAAGARVARASSGKVWSNSTAILSMSLTRGFGDSNTELGGGSMMGVVQIIKEAGTV